MTFPYISVEDAITRPGLRMIVVGGVPSPWGEAAKGLLHIKRIDWAAVRLVYDSEALKEWGGEGSGPVAIYDNEKPRTRWNDILLLAERLSPEPALLPNDPAERALAFGLSHEIVGEDGLAWSRRLDLVHAGLQNSGGFPERVSKYLAKKYAFSPAAGAAAASDLKTAWRGRGGSTSFMPVCKIRAASPSGYRNILPRNTPSAPRPAPPRLPI